jgi:hypothetical protein
MGVCTRILCQSEDYICTIASSMLTAQIARSFQHAHSLSTFSDSNTVCCLTRLDHSRYDFSTQGTSGLAEPRHRGMYHVCIECKPYRTEVFFYPFEFLVTFTISLMKSIDIRCESAVKLLAEFLDLDSPYFLGARHTNAEHFAHGWLVFCHSFDTCNLC